MTNSKKSDAKSKAAPQKRAGVFDVAHPGSGQLATSTTSKPVIVTNRPVIQDPMVVADGQPEEVASTAPVLTPVKKKVIMPSSDFVADAEPESEPKPEPEEAPKESSPEPVETEKSEPVQGDEPKITTESGQPVTMLEPEPQAGVPAPAEEREEKGLRPDQAAAAEQSAKERQAHLQEMIDNEEYFLPVNAAEKRHRRFAIIGLFVIIVLALIWYNVALDAGLLPNTYNLPHTSFFTIKAD